ncbi:MAG: type II secretion system protein GspC [Bacteriovoracia bacterium]
MSIFDRFKKLKPSTNLREKAKTLFSAASKKASGAYTWVKTKTSKLVSIENKRAIEQNLKKLPEQASRVAKKIKDSLPKNFEDWKKMPAAIESGLEKFRSAASSKSYGTYMRMGAAAFAAYFLADTVSLFTDALVPDPPPVPAPKIVAKDSGRKSIEEYSSILTRNVFNSKGLIPDEDPGSAPARKTTLPFNLIGTVVLKDEIKSIATIEDKSQNLVFPVRIDDSIANKAKITKIEHLRVYFINQSTGHLEYVEVLEDLPQLNTQVRITPTRSKKEAGIHSKDGSHFDVERSALDKALGNLHEVLQQARAIPNFENGIPDGYKLLQITPGSIFAQIGLQNNDVFCGINGESVNDPGKALQVFNELKTANHLDVCVKRNGRKMSLSYDIR